MSAIGTNAIPHLLAMLRCSDSQAKVRLVMYFKRYPFIQKLIPTGFPKRQRAMYGFRALGLEAPPAIPAIVSLVLNSSDNGHAIGALSGAQEEDIVLIAQALSNPDREVRVRAAFALGCLRQAPPIAVPALTKALSDSDTEVRATAAGSLDVYQRAGVRYVSQGATCSVSQWRWERVFATGIPDCKGRGARREWAPSERGLI